MAAILTVGYEGLCREEFLLLLRQNKVDLVADVRDLPLSRKRGFSKTPLAQSLLSLGIGYRHFRELGAPKELRVHLRTTGDWQKYERSYKELLESRFPVLDELGLLALTQRVCLLCFEKDPFTCHRRLIAEALIKGGWVKEAIDLRTGELMPAASAK